MPAHAVPRYYKLFTAKKINEKTNITIPFQKIEKVVEKGFFLALSQQDYLNLTNSHLIADGF